MCIGAHRCEGRSLRCDLCFEVVRSPGGHGARQMQRRADPRRALPTDPVVRVLGQAGKMLDALQLDAVLWYCRIK
jgi:hypothetical protein